MYLEAKKIHLIEEVLKIKNESVLTEIETVLKKYNSKAKKRPSIFDFVGIISKNDAEKMNIAITECCETIDEDDWK